MTDSKILWCVVGWCGLMTMPGCTRIRQTAELWSEQRQLTQRAREAQEQGDMSQAADLLTQAVNTDPRNCETRLELSELLLEHGSLDASIQNLQRVVEQNPDDPRGYVRLAQALMLQNREDQAEPLLRMALELDPGHPLGLLLFAQWLERHGEMRQALETYYRAIPLLGNPAEAEIRIAAIKLRNGQITQATALLRGVVENAHVNSTTKGEAYALLGQAYSREQRWHAAAVALESSLKYQSRTPTAADWQAVAEAHARAGDWQSASRCASAANGNGIPGEPRLAANPQFYTAPVAYESSQSPGGHAVTTPYFAARP